MFPCSDPQTRQPAILAARSNRYVLQNDRDNPSRLHSAVLVEWPAKPGLLRSSWSAALFNPALAGQPDR